MKKWIPFLIAILATLTVSAQYKKASFFQKEGRTYELGARLYMMGDGRGTPIGYQIGFGRDLPGTRLFSSWEIQMIPSFKYTYSTVDGNNSPIYKSGTAKRHWVYAFNYGFHLLNNDEPTMVQPYLTAGMHILLAGGVKDETETQGSGYPQRNTSEQTASFGLAGGAGVFVNFTDKLGLKIQGGYSHQFNISADRWDDGVKPYYLFPSHPYVSASLRLKLIPQD